MNRDRYHNVDSKDSEQDLRRRAEKTARGETARMPENLDALTPEAVRQLVHELLVHQIELEMQNEELRRAQQEIEASHARYFELYNLAPVGYFTVSAKGLILEINLTAANLLGATRGDLIKQRWTRFILPEDQDIYYLHHKLLLETGVPQTCEMRIVRQDGTSFWTRLEATRAEDADGVPMCRCAMSDITPRKQVEEALQQAHDELEQRVAERTEALRESEEKLRIISDHLVDVLYATDNSNFITFISPSAMQMIGWKPEDMIGRNFIDFLPDSEIPDAVAQFLGAIASGNSTQHLPFVMKRKDESTFSVELSSSVIWKDGRIAGTAGIIRDITERKQAEEALQESEERYRNQVESINDVAYAVGAGGEITYVSPVVKSVLGYEPDEMTGRHFIEFVHKDDHDLLKRKFSELREGMVSPDEYRFIAKGGEIKWVRTQTRPINEFDGFAGGRGILIDITRQKQTEESLRTSEERYRSLASSVDSLYLVDRDCRYLFMNEGCRLRFGAPLEDIIGKRYHDFHSENNSKEFEKIVKGVFSTGKPIQLEYQSERAKGYLLRTFSPAMDREEKTIVAITIASKDITERKSLELQLIQAQKMDALGTLTSGIAHDFNGIIASVIGFAEMAMEEPDDAQRSEYLDKVMVSCDHAKELVTQISSFSRKSSVEKKPLDIGMRVRKFVKLLRSTTPPTIEIKQHISSESLVALANSTQIHQVMMNLCANATHAMKDKGGALAIRLSSTDITSDSPLVSLDLAPGPHLKLEVRDSGYGIDPADMGRVFDPFFTTKGVSEGTGLGLSVVYGIVKSHGGAVTVDSEVGSGSTFTVYLPALQQHAEGEEVETEVGEMPHGRHERILFVDDEASVVEIGRGILKKLGYVVLDFTDSVQACEAFRQSPYAYDLVITDMAMPHLTGIELSREILKIRPEMPIILCTGYSDVISEEKAMQEGVRRFIMKPLRRRELAKAVRDVLDKERLTS